MSEEEWCCEQLENLKIKENRLATLTEIRVRLNETSPRVENVINRLLSAPEIYDCLEEHAGSADISFTNNSNEQVDLASDILSICMGNLSISQTQSNLPQLLKRALEHQRPRIRALALNTILKELERLPSSAVEATNQLVPDELLIDILGTLQQEETEVGVPSLKILTLVLENRLELVKVREGFASMLKKNETIRCRVYELAVNLAKRSSATLQKVEYLLDGALSEIDNDDIIMQVNILEILVPLAEQNHGLVYLERRKVFELLSKRVETLEQNPIDRLLIPGIMKFFGKIASMQPQKIITGYPHMIGCLFECIHSGDTTILPSAFDTLANLALSQQGKVLLDAQYNSALKNIFEDYAAYLRNLSSDMKNRAFDTLEVIFTTPGLPSQQTIDILQKWFTYLAGGSNMQFLMDFCRNPFPDIKVACLSFILAVCQYQWGIVALKNTAGFVEYLLDRKIEFHKDAKYLKYQLIEVLAKSRAFDVHTQNQLNTYINEGPYYVQSFMDVAVEGN